MFNKRLLISTVVVFVFIFFYEFLFHGLMLSADYEMLPNIMRSNADTEAMFHFLALGLLIMAYMFCAIFERGYENKGLAEGARYGLLIGILMSAPSLVFFAVMQFSGDLIVKWIVGGLAEMVAAGVILALVYAKLKG